MILSVGGGNRAGNSERSKWIEDLGGDPGEDLGLDSLDNVPTVDQGSSDHQLQYLSEDSAEDLGKSLDSAPSTVNEQHGSKRMQILKASIKENAQKKMDIKQEASQKMMTIQGKINEQHEKLAHSNIGESGPIHIASSGTSPASSASEVRRVKDPTVQQSLSPASTYPDSLSKFIVSSGLTQDCADGEGIALDMQKTREKGNAATQEKNPAYPGLVCQKPGFYDEGACMASCVPALQSETNRQPTFCAINCVRMLDKIFANIGFHIWCHFQKQIYCPLDQATKRAGKACHVHKNAELFSVRAKHVHEHAKNATITRMRKDDAFATFGNISNGSLKTAKEYEEKFGLCRDILLPN